MKKTEKTIKEDIITIKKLKKKYSDEEEYSFESLFDELLDDINSLLIELINDDIDKLLMG